MLFIYLFIIKKKTYRQVFLKTKSTATSSTITVRTQVPQINIKMSKARAYTHYSVSTYGFERGRARAGLSDKCGVRLRRCQPPSNKVAPPTPFHQEKVCLHTYQISELIESGELSVG